MGISDKKQPTWIRKQTKVKDIVQMINTEKWTWGTMLYIGLTTVKEKRNSGKHQMIRKIKAAKDTSGKKYLKHLPYKKQDGIHILMLERRR